MLIDANAKVEEIISAADGDNERGCFANAVVNKSALFGVFTICARWYLVLHRNWHDGYVVNEPHWRNLDMLGELVDDKLL